MGFTVMPRRKIGLIDRMVSNEVIDAAYEHVRGRRIHYSCNSDIWDLRQNWKEEKEKIRDAVKRGEYKFDAVKVIEKDGERLEIWSAGDAVVLKALEIVLKEKMLRGSPCSSCHHLKGRGGIKEAIGKVRRNLNNYKYVFRTDVKKYYASIDHDALFNILENYIGETPALSLLYQFMKRTVYRDGYYRNIEKGICRGSSLSPMIGALYLEGLDKAMGKSNCFYARFMDDWVIMTKNKWSFRRIIKKVNRMLGGRKLKKAEEKTFIGKIEKGFDFLGFHFGKDGLSIAKVTVRKFAERLALRLTSGAGGSAENSNSGNDRGQWKSGRVYDSGQMTDKHKKGVLPIPDSVSMYIQRWIRWVKSVYEKNTLLRSATVV